MNFYRIFDKIFILLLVIFSISCSTTSIDAEKHVLTPFPGVKYSPEKPPVAELPAIIPPAVKINRNTLGCVFPFQVNMPAWEIKRGMQSCWLRG